MWEREWRGWGRREESGKRRRGRRGWGRGDEIIGVGNWWREGE